jgi:hypothetical protein
MVDANTYDRDGGALGAANQDHGVETPASVGTDERRMHVRAYNYWVSLLDGRAYPSIEDLNPETLDDFGPNSVLLDFTGGIEDPVISFLGRALQKECGLSDEVRSISDIPSRSLLSRLTDHYLQIIANRAPIGFEAEYLNDRGNNTMYRGILMPFSSDDDTIDFIYGVINWKEVAEAALEASLQDEVERALLATPRRQAVETPVWADGPSAEILDEATPGFDDDDEDEIVPDFVPTGNEGLADWLVAAREAAEVAERTDSRSRSALYGALARAYDFALVADTNADEYHQLLIDSGIAVQERAPMTPVVKLVFGATYDKTRLAEYASALTYGRHQGVSSGGFQAFLDGFRGGLKGVVRAERAERRPVAAVSKPNRHAERARKMQTGVILEAEGDEEFVILVARRVDEGHIAVLGRTAPDDALLQKALRQLQG